MVKSAVKKAPRKGLIPKGIKKRGAPPPASMTTKTIRLPGPGDLNEPPTNFLAYTTLIFGAKGIGKSTAGSTFPNSLTIMLEPKRRNLKIRMVPTPDNPTMFKPKTPDEIRAGWEQGIPSPWENFHKVLELAMDDPSIKHVNIDTVDLAYDMCLNHICAKAKCDHPQDKNDFGKTWNKVKEEFIATFDAIRYSERLGLTFISHAKERDVEFREVDSEATMIAPTCTGQALQYIKSACDYMLFYGFHEDKRCVTVRDPSNTLMVSAGTGFEYPDGTPVERVFIPSDPTKFYETVNAAFQGKVAKPKPKPKPVLKKTA